MRQAAVKAPLEVLVRETWAQNMLLYLIMDTWIIKLSHRQRSTLLDLLVRQCGYYATSSLSVLKSYGIRLLLSLANWSDTLQWFGISQGSWAQWPTSTPKTQCKEQPLPPGGRPEFLSFSSWDHMSFTTSPWTLCFSQMWNATIEREAVSPYTMRWYVVESLSTQGESAQGSSAVLITCGRHKKDSYTKILQQTISVPHKDVQAFLPSQTHVNTCTSHPWALGVQRTPPLQFST